MVIVYYSGYMYDINCHKHFNYIALATTVTCHYTVLTVGSTCTIVTTACLNHHNMSQRSQHVSTASLKCQLHVLFVITHN